ncbi:methionine--tRNA ligase [Candidatus Nomurabacteria bacterium RIFCSPHIGHO2_01_FULL_42_15]|uniref:Methionine--tRNA ligase n=1 Tax=Candidatus Nomurabacteria bacterium RIFCSPHIGHO2_01_FULL_42_15 TaxID=1801742 RepID=A0A1F6VEC6_9BACT|nr:MAG: methionine--tRNA ligase [Candidatus Nomurabacteria bacterium RIFCSPHIGHO2_01_FULL_42_15]OGI93319.1 MAG: methionine--tRNA ligase [Candidatus Nomurabacteria bacterium RIFCSPLOWO2_01_FULL_41_18]
MKKDSFYITTTIPYVNADPHIGFALELVQGDAIARYQRLYGREVFFSTGTDEYGQKIWEASIKEGKNVQDYVDHYAQKFIDLKGTLDLSYDNFIRTTSKEHVRATQEFWRLCDVAGDIYKKIYRGLYCVGCEKFLTEKDLMEGVCSLHPNKTPEMVEEENYFFKLTKYKEQLLQYLSNKKVIIPEWRRQEAIDFVKDGMEDFSISRNKERFSWGIPIPGDDKQVMYVWFGAFINYISTLGWPDSKGKFEKFWQEGKRIQVAGKDMVKFQSVMWQGMLMSAGMPATDVVVYHGFITGEGGVKMSKSLGNVVSPNEIVKEYSTDALRYFLLREISSFEDSPFTMERFKDAYNSGLANGLGNLVSRILTLSEKYLEKCPEILEHSMPQEFKDHLDKFEIQKAVNFTWNEIGALDRFIQETEPFKVVKTDKEKGKKIITDMVLRLYTIARMLNPIMPETNILLKALIKANKKPDKPLFPRKD